MTVCLLGATVTALTGNRVALGAQRLWSDGRRWLETRSGGPARARVILLLGGVLAADAADVATIGATAAKLETALRISNTELGLLASIPSLMTALATVPVGLLTDRTNRVRLLVAGIVAWSLAEAVSGVSQSFLMLLLIRMALGLFVAPAGPTLSSLVGDFFPARDRGYIYGLILSGELIGAGFGFLISGEFASLLSWRAAFVVLALPSLAVAYAIKRWLPEPARGGQSRLEPGATEIIPAGSRAAQRAPADHSDEVERTVAQRGVAEQDIRPEEDLVLDRDPAEMSLWRATRYVLRVRTNVVLIVASALGYYYFTGVQTFGVELVQGRFGLSHGVATLVVVALGVAALIGVVAGGSLADWLLGRGKLNARILVGGASYVIAALLFLPGLLLMPLAAAMPFFLLAAIAFAGRDPPLNAARLDVMHHRLWGRAEAVRTVLRRLMVAAAPVSFGALADALGSGRTVSGANGFGAGASAQGLHLTFLMLLITLAAGGVLTFGARFTYPRDVATALASEERTASQADRAVPARAAVAGEGRT